MISDDQLKTCEKKLLKRQSELIDKLRDDYDMDLTLEETASELTSFDLNHPADTATALYERSKDLSFKNQFENELEEINQALYAIEEGTYGICSICGTAIDYDRLLALPATDRCQEHADMDHDMYDWEEDV